MKKNNILGKLGDGFAALRTRDRMIAIAAVALVLFLVGNLLLLKPQLLAINSLKMKESTISIQLGETSRALVSYTVLEEKGLDPFAAERATLAELKGEFAKVSAFMGSEDHRAVSQVSILVRGLIKSNPGLTLVSLKTRPGVVFYTPPVPPPPKQGVQKEIDKVLDLAKAKKEDEVKQKAPIVLVKNPLYKHGVEVSVKGTYPVLMGYLEDMEKLPHRIFWSEATLDAGNYREATLRLLVHTVSDLPVSPPELMHRDRGPYNALPGFGNFR